MRKNHSKLIYGLSVVVIVLGVIVVLSIISSNKSSSNQSKLQVVAAENFWGSLVSQIGGDKISVTSIVSDPNADPHEYESNTATALKFNDANYVITNGAGYDSWADKLLSASNNPNRKVLNIASLLGKKEGDNPHFWYNPAYVNTVIVSMDKNLDAIDPSDSNYFDHNLATLKLSLGTYQNNIKVISQQFAGTKVAATEDIFAYLAGASNLDLISPSAFTQAVAEGNDPPTDSVVQFQQQITAKQPKILVYNTQTVTPLTDSIKSLAQQENIPIVGISETIEPPNVSFQDWMNKEILNIQKELQATKNN